MLLETVLVTESSLLDRAQIGEIAFAHYRLQLIGVISADPTHLKHRNSYPLKQQHFYFNPEAHFVLRPKDILMVLGAEYSIGHFRAQIEQSGLLSGKQA